MVRESNQLTLFNEDESEVGRVASSTFADNLTLPIHRWYRYSAGFSADWVRSVLKGERVAGRRRVLDPFAGSGTVLLEAERCGFESIGLEAHPFVVRVARAKLLWRENASEFRKRAIAVLKDARSLKEETPGFPPLIQKCFPPEVLSRLFALNQAWTAHHDGTAHSELTWLVLASILRECSPVGTAQWQYVLPKKTKARPTDPFDAFLAKVHLMADDMLTRQQLLPGPPGMLRRDDARSCSEVHAHWADLVVTSPPYTNNYDYADATRLEMSFFGDVTSWGDLQDTVRKFLLHSCTQHVSGIVRETQQILADPILNAIGIEIQSVCGRLEAERANHGGKKNYHTMIAAYFRDMASVWQALRRVTSHGALACFVVGDSAPYGVHIPVERWLGELAVGAGFSAFEFEKTRDRNVKWRNRKHRVPLQEGRLWVRG